MMDRTLTPHHSRIPNLLLNLLLFSSQLVTSSWGCSTISSAVTIPGPGPHCSVAVEARPL